MFDGSHFVEAVTLEACAATCAPVAHFLPPREPPEARLSPDGRHAFVIDRDLGQDRWRLAMFSVVGSPKHLGTTELGDAFDPQRGSTGYLWTRSGGVLITWGAGTYASVGHLYRDGVPLLGFSASAFEVSPDGRFMATFAPAGAPLAESLVVFDLATGAKVFTSMKTQVLSLGWYRARVIVVTTDRVWRVPLTTPR